MTAETTIIDALAVCRLTRLATKDSLFATPRIQLLDRLDRGGPVARKAAEGLSCPWCLSWWLAIGVLVARNRMPRAWSPLARTLAASHIAGLVADLDVD